MKTPIVKLQRFIQAIRDAGYRGTGAALSELIDNSFEADAREVRVEIAVNPDNKEEIVSIEISDDGCGMSSDTIEAALQFGGSSRFGSRKSTGRYGMGLPNSSVSQARRVDVYSWQHKGTPLWSYLDVDQIAEGKCKVIPRPVPKDLPYKIVPITPSHGTVILWRQCDRLNPRRPASLVHRLHKELGRVFRFSLWKGLRVRINGQELRPHDPLYLRPGINLVGSSQYGPDIEYPVKIDPTTGQPMVSKVIVRFAELPIENWYAFSNEEKRRHGISKNAGVSILRAGREIDYGWFFMGSKRKENYDDWWRCEVDFQPDLDELFGVTHTKQGINPTDELNGLLAPDLEQVAHQLNSRVRRRYMKLKPDLQGSSARLASEKDVRFEPPKSAVAISKNGRSNYVPASPGATFKLKGLKYKLVVEDLHSCDFFMSQLKGTCLTVTLNRLHPFFERVCSVLPERDKFEEAVSRRQVELLVLAAARAEVGLIDRQSRKTFQQFRNSWSNLLAAFLT
jgi:hypothetical protein